MMTVIPIILDVLWAVPKCLEKNEGTGNQRKNWDHPDHSIVNIDHNSEKSHRDLGNLHSLRLQITLVLKTDSELNNNNNNNNNNLQILRNNGSWYNQTSENERKKLNRLTQEKLITATWKNIDDTRISKTKITRKKWEEKQLYGHFTGITSDTYHEKTWTWRWKGYLKRETESLRMAAQNNAIRTNHIKARIDTYFFVQTFQIVVDSWEFSRLLLCILWDNGPIL